MQIRVSTLSKPKQLLVEGMDEVMFFSAFMRELRIDDVQIINCRGKDNLKSVLLEITQNPDFPFLQSIGIVRDADDSAGSAFQSVQSALIDSGLPVPGQMLIPSTEFPQTTVFIMPDNGGAGALEQLCLVALADDPAMPCVADFMQCVRERALAEPRNWDKAQIHAFLASREDPELRLGEAAQRGYMPWGSSAFTELPRFLRAF